MKFKPMTMADLRTATEGIPDYAWVSLKDGPLQIVEKELGASEPFVLLSTVQPEEGPMSEPKYTPTYVELYNEQMMRAVAMILNPDLLKDQRPTKLVRMDEEKWLVKLEFDMLKSMRDDAAVRDNDAFVEGIGLRNAEGGASREQNKK